MAYREYPNLILRRQELVERDVTGPAVGNDQLAQILFHAPADQGVARQRIDRFADHRSRSGAGTRIVLGKKFKRALEVAERVLRIDYLRHG